MISFHPDYHALIGLAVTVVLGLGVGCLLRCVGDSLPLPPPNSGAEEQWKKLASPNTGGYWTGSIERPLFFAALWISGAWPLLTSWLVFKLAFHWQSANFIAFPERLPSSEDFEYIIAKRKLGAHHAATVLIGTGVNIVLALIGVAVGKWIVVQ